MPIVVTLVAAVSSISALMEVVFRARTSIWGSNSPRNEYKLGLYLTVASFESTFGPYKEKKARFGVVRQV
jgi:hypothetical protein